MIIDLVIAASVIAAAIAGFQLGLLQPLLAELCFLAVVSILWAAHGPYGHLLQAVFHANAVMAVCVALGCAIVAGYAGGRLGGFIHRMPAVCGADGFLGLFVQPLVAVLACYVVVSGLVAIDRAMTPTETGRGLTPSQVEASRRQLRANPLSGALADGSDWASLERRARAGGARVSASSQLGRVQGFAQDFGQPQVSGSRLTPLVLAIGHAVGGNLGPADLGAQAGSRAGAVNGAPGRSRSRTPASARPSS